MTNRETTESARDLILEAAGPRLTSRPTLDYYTPRRRGRRRIASGTPTIQPESYGFVFEAAGPSSILPDAILPGTPLESLREYLPDASVASLGEDAVMLEAVIGNDDRVRVKPETMRQNPWRQICALRIRSASGQEYVGTGWFIGPRTLATAGHCVFLQDDGGWAESIKVIPAKQGGLEPFDRQVSRRFASVDGWVKDRKRDFDYGVIFLDDDRIGRQLGNFEVQAPTPNELRGTDAQISGYPADRDSANFQYFHLRPLKDITDTRLVYEIDTFGGQSGSPVWQHTTERGVVAVGIHTTGGLTSNSGTRITEDVLDNLISWTLE